MRVSSATTQLAIAPGERSELTVEVVNTGRVIDGITARIIGLPDRTVTARPAMLPLFPDASGEITLAIDLPSTFPAGDHPLTVEIASRQTDTPPEYVNIDVTVPRAPAIELTSRPAMVRARRTGRFIVTVTNRGNAHLDVNLTATDPQKNCAIIVTPPITSLPPGESAEAVVTVRGRRIWMGTEQDRSLIAQASGRAVLLDPLPIGAVPTEYDVPLGVADGTDLAPDTAATQVESHTPIIFRQRPYLTRGLLTALILLAIIAVWAAVFLFGLSKVFAGDPLTKAAPASFFAATPQQGQAGTSSGTGAGTTGSGAAGSSGAAAGAGGAAAGGAAGAAGSAAPAGALPKSGTLPAGVGGAISGTVTAASSGEPVGRILVTALRVKADGSTVVVASAATQTDGTYQVAGLFPGPYVLQFAAPGFRTTYYPTASTEADAKKLTATTGGVTSGGNAVVIGLPATISGKVDFGDITTPITGTVSARLLGASNGSKVVIPDVKTAADGSYKFANVPAPGTYVLTLAADGYQTSTLQTTVTGGANRFVSAAVLSAGDAQISGTVTDGTSPVGGATVSVTVNGQLQSTGTPTVGQVGHFAIGNLPTPATYILTVSKDGYGPVSQVIDLAPSGQQGDLTIVLTAGTGVVEGTVTGIGGVAVGGATVTAGGLANPPTTTTLTDGPIGSFRLEGLPVPGSYTITVVAPGYAAQTVPVQLAADAVLPPIQVALSPSMGVITGQVLGAGGKGVAGAAVSVTDGQKIWPVVTTSGSGGVPAGSFTVADLPSGRYTVTATTTDSTGAAHSQTTLADVVAGSPLTLTFRMGGS
ncbi:MAG: carboxypeptidase regulatory-like domain-containing protein [Nakamurella sp.]